MKVKQACRRDGPGGEPQGKGERADKSRVKRIERVFFVDFDRKIIDLFRILQGMRRFFE